MTHPYPGELIYSTIARYQRNMNISSTKASDLIFSIRLNVNNYESGFLITKLNKVAQKLKCAYTGEAIIDQNTTFNYDAAFYSACNKEKAKAIYLNGGVAFNQFRRENLRFCPVCLHDDVEKYGEPYFHVLHQLEGIFICPICHTPLINYTSDKIFEFICLEDSAQPSDKLVIPLIFCEIANMAKQLMSQVLSDEFEVIMAKIITLLKKRNAWKKNTISNNLIEDIREVYKTDELIKGYYNFNIDDICDEMSKVCLKKKRPVVKTITYLILIHHLAGSLENFKNTLPDKKHDSIQNPCKEISINKNLLNKHKQKVLKLAGENLTRKLLYEEYKSSYNYLKEHANDWLESKLPKPLPNKILEYDEIKDIEIKEIIQDEQAKLLENGERIYIGNLKKNKALRLHMRKLNLLPISKEYVNTITETYEQYYRRKIRNTIDELIKNDMEISYNKIFNMVCNDPRKNELVKTETDIYLNEIGINNIRIHKCSKLKWARC